MSIIKRIRVMLGCSIAIPGAHMWQPAFNEGREEKYEDLRLSEKVGYQIMNFGVRTIAGLSQEDLDRVAEKYENR